jgi:glutathione synthase/RimK-type ligase-like ATP-grasp enzyme
VNVLLTGGRAPVALDLARAFQRAGHTVFMAESLRGHLSQPSAALKANFIVPAPRQQTQAFLAALRNIINDCQIDLLIPTCEEIFHVAQGLDVLPCRVFTERLEKLNEFHNKWRFAESVKTCGLSVPESLLVTCVDDVASAYRRWDGVVLKPIYSRFAARTLIRLPLDEALPRLTFDEPWLAQQYIEGRQFCTYSVCQHGRITAHATYSTIFTAGQGATIAFQPVEHPAIFAWVQTFVAAYHVTGQMAFDFIQTPDGEIYALECNPRSTSGLHLLTPDSQFVESFFREDLPCVMPRHDVARMLGTAMLVYGLPTALFSGQFRAWLQTFLRSGDVIFDHTDLQPFLLQLRSILAYVRLGRRQHITPLEASTFDIEWNGARDLL